MDGVSRASAAGFLLVSIPKAWKGPEQPQGDEDGFDEYKWPPMRVEEYAVVERHLLANRISPIDAVLPEIERLEKLGTPSARRMAKRLEKNAYNDLRKSKASNKLTIDEVQSWLDCVDGVLFTMKLCLQRNHPDITDAEVRRVFDWLGEREAKRVRDVASGNDALGNSTGPTPIPATAESAGRSRGESSTDGSPKSTDGAPQW